MMLSNVGIAIRNPPFFDGLYHPFMVIGGIVYDIAIPTLREIIFKWLQIHAEISRKDGHSTTATRTQLLL